MELAQYIDHTLLKPEATEQDVMKLIEEAKQYHFASVCLNPYWVKRAKTELADSDVKVCTVIGFPLGATLATVKAYETSQAIRDGADEVDMVLNIGALKAGDEATVLADIEAVVQAAQGKIVKVIIETCLLTDEQKVLACQLAEQAGADFVKTSTGFAGGGATFADVALMKATVSAKVKVKASGAIRDRQTAIEMIQAGADRIGTSSGIKIVKK